MNLNPFKFSNLVCHAFSLYEIFKLYEFLPYYRHLRNQRKGGLLDDKNRDYGAIADHWEKNVSGLRTYAINGTNVALLDDKNQDFTAIADH